MKVIKTTIVVDVVLVQVVLKLGKYLEKVPNSSLRWNFEVYSNDEHSHLGY